MEPIEGQCEEGWTWHWDGHCIYDDGGGSGGGTYDGGGTSGGGSAPSGGYPAPAGFEQAEWDQLTDAEKALVLFDDPPKWLNRRHEMRTIRDFAINESLRLSGAANEDDGTRQNAFQHALWAARMAISYGYMDALRWTNAHEEGPRPIHVSEELWNQHKSMDLKNNALGLSWYWRPYGTESEWVMQSQAQLCWIEGVGARSCF